MTGANPSIDELVTAVERSTLTLAESVSSLTAEQVRGECGLPGWTRGHLLTHLSRNANGLRNLLLSARTAEPLPMYAPGSARDEDIRVGAERLAHVIVDDHTLSHQALATEIRHLPDDLWRQPVTLHSATGPVERPASAILAMRLREVEIHHVDLSIGHDYRSTHPATVHLLLHQAVERHTGRSGRHLDFTATDTGHRYAVRVSRGSELESDRASAPASQLLCYLTGRAHAGPLLAHLPAPPVWG